MKRIYCSFLFLNWAKHEGAVLVFVKYFPQKLKLFMNINVWFSVLRKSADKDSSCSLGSASKGKLLEEGEDVHFPWAQFASLISLAKAQTLNVSSSKKVESRRR